MLLEPKPTPQPTPVPTKPLPVIQPRQPLPPQPQPVPKPVIIDDHGLEERVRKENEWLIEYEKLKKIRHNFFCHFY